MLTVILHSVCWNVLCMCHADILSGLRHMSYTTCRIMSDNCIVNMRSLFVSSMHMVLHKLTFSCYTWPHCLPIMLQGSDDLVPKFAQASLEKCPHHAMSMYE